MVLEKLNMAGLGTMDRTLMSKSYTEKFLGFSCPTAVVARVFSAKSFTLIEPNTVPMFVESKFRSNTVPMKPGVQDIPNTIAGNTNL